jgi:non-ribosomal peptide synthetase component E (peptide arylation enzyme)
VSVVARLPRTTLGKTDKKALRAAYQAAVPGRSAATASGKPR